MAENSFNFPSFSSKTPRVSRKKNRYNLDSKIVKIATWKLSWCASQWIHNTVQNISIHNFKTPPSLKSQNYFFRLSTLFLTNFSLSQYPPTTSFHRQHREHFNLIRIRKYMHMLNICVMIWNVMFKVWLGG